jgi:hypothetical protein
LKRNNLLNFGAYSLGLFSSGLLDGKVYDYVLVKSETFYSRFKFNPNEIKRSNLECQP